jgi:hypothetical protein
MRNVIANTAFHALEEYFVTKQANTNDERRVEAMALCEDFRWLFESVRCNERKKKVRDGHC